MPTDHSCDEIAAQATFLVAVLHRAWSSYDEIPEEVEQMLTDRIRYLSERCARVKALVKGMWAEALDELQTPQV